MLAVERSSMLRSCGGCTSAFRGTKPRIASVVRPSIPRNALVVHAKSAVAAPASLPVKSLEGAELGTKPLALKVADPETAKGLVHRYLVYVQANRRRGTASTLTRSEVRGGGRKPYKQKGTGNARRGSTTSPLMPGGGVIFGPKPKDWSIKMNHKERRLALATALQSAAEDIIVVDSLAGIDQPKTKLVVAGLENLGVDAVARNTLLIVNEYTQTLELATRNIEKLSVNTASAIRVFDVLKAHKIVIEASALESLQAQYSS